jgi:hypothetical protein
LGDFALLFVAHGLPAQADSLEAMRTLLWIGGVLGVVTIPMYALGYATASHIVSAASVGGARTVLVAGAVGSLLGSFIHGVTAVHIGTDLGSATQASDPLAAVASSPLLVALWGLAAVSMAIASAVFCWHVARGATSAPRSASLANPVLVTLVLVCVGLPFVPGRAYLVPAAPNLAHLVFFIVCLGSSGLAHRRGAIRDSN